MSTEQFVICLAVAMSVALGILALFIRQLQNGQAQQSKAIDQMLKRSLTAEIDSGVIDGKVSSLQEWAKSYIAFQDHWAKERMAHVEGLESSIAASALRMDELNKRLIQTETENKNPAPSKRDEDEDPFSGARSWAAQAAAAERGSGVRSVA